MYIISKKTIESEEYDISLSSVSSIYLLMYRINLKDDTFEEINCNLSAVADMVGDKRRDAGKLIKNVVTLRSDDRTREDILEFVDLSTLKERLANLNTVTCEFMNSDKIWNRARFIVAERDEKGNLDIKNAAYGAPQWNIHPFVGFFIDLTRVPKAKDLSDTEKETKLVIDGGGLGDQKPEAL